MKQQSFYDGIIFRKRCPTSYGLCSSSSSRLFLASIIYSCANPLFPSFYPTNSLRHLLLCKSELSAISPCDPTPPSHWQLRVQLAAGGALMEEGPGSDGPGSSSWLRELLLDWSVELPAVPVLKVRLALHQCYQLTSICSAGGRSPAPRAETTTCRTRCRKAHTHTRYTHAKHTLHTQQAHEITQ